jgi:hypothetical protein
MLPEASAEGNINLEALNIPYMHKKTVIIIYIIS